MSTPASLEPEFKALQEYLRTGRLNARLLRSAAWSIIADPFRSVLGAITGPLGYILRRIYWQRRMKHFGSGSLLDVGVFVYGPARIEIGDFTWIDSQVKLLAPYGGIRIGSRCHVGTGVYISGAGEVAIEDYVGIGPYAVLLSSTEHPADGKRMSGPMVPLEQRALRQGRIHIQREAFIGSHSIVMPGVTIGEGAVVAAHSVVTRDVEPYAIVSGVPAQKISERAAVTQRDL